MLPEITHEEFAAALDACAGEVLWEASVTEPPVDAVAVAQRIGLVVTNNKTIAGRAQFVRLQGPASGPDGRGTIVVGAAERPERQQWAVAHEIGESVAHRVFAALGVAAEAAPDDTRERVANHLAGCLLLPRRWFVAEGKAHDWDLAIMKQHFATASHELIARRMLEMKPPVVITLCDLGRVRWRRWNLAGRPPRLLPEEREVWFRSHTFGEPESALLDSDELGVQRICCWPVHEPDWKREIIRSEIVEW